MLTLRWFGISCFEITNKVTIVTDPHDGESLGLHPPDIKGDLILITHQHFDHASGREVVSKADSEIVEESGKWEVKGIEIEGVPYHREEAGENVFFKFELDGFRICHLGDLGYSLSSKEVEKIKPVDILLVPVGGTGGHEGREAAKVIEDLKPRIVIPQHYMVEGMTVPISSKKEFLQLAIDRGWLVEERKEARIKSLPERRKIIVLECLSRY